MTLNTTTYITDDGENYITFINDFKYRGKTYPYILYCKGNGRSLLKLWLKEIRSHYEGQDILYMLGSTSIFGNHSIEIDSDDKDNKLYKYDWRV